MGCNEVGGLEQAVAVSASEDDGVVLFLVPNDDMLLTPSVVLPPRDVRVRVAVLNDPSDPREAFASTKVGCSFLLFFTL